jgi:hypothetical protein
MTTESVSIGLEPSPRSARVWPWAAIAAAVVVMVVAMRLQGRIWISESGMVSLWHTDVWSSECSQQFADPYSITHVSHGLFFALFFGAVGRWLAARGVRPAGDWRWQLTAGVWVAAGWEIAENSAAVIERYRTATMSLNYMGDSILNATGDVVSCVVGFFLARRLGTWKTLAFFAATELLLLWLIRDNLTLNVIMLLHPIDAIREWQAAGP